MKKKKLSKRMDYPVVVFLQMNKVNKIMSDERMTWQVVKRLERALIALECNLKAKTGDKKAIEVSDVNIEEKEELFLSLVKKYQELNNLAEEIGILGIYTPDAPTYGDDYVE